MPRVGRVERLGIADQALQKRVGDAVGGGFGGKECVAEHKRDGQWGRADGTSSGGCSVTARASKCNRSPTRANMRALQRKAAGIRVCYEPCSNFASPRPMRFAPAWTAAA